MSKNWKKLVVYMLGLGIRSSAYWSTFYKVLLIEDKILSTFWFLSPNWCPHFGFGPELYFFIFLPTVQNGYLNLIYTYLTQRPWTSSNWLMFLTQQILPYTVNILYTSTIPMKYERILTNWFLLNGRAKTLCTYPFC